MFNAGFLDFFLRFEILGFGSRSNSSSTEEVEVDVEHGPDITLL